MSLPRRYQLQGASWLEVGLGVCLPFSAGTLSALNCAAPLCVPVSGRSCLLVLLCLSLEPPATSDSQFSYILFPVGSPALREGFDADIQVRAECFKTLILYITLLWVSDLITLY